MSICQFNFLFQCSKRCGEGLQYRKVRCRQLLSLGQTIDKPERECSGTKPTGEEWCNGTECDKVHLHPKIKILKGNICRRLVLDLSINIPTELNFCVHCVVSKVPCKFSPLLHLSVPSEPFYLKGCRSA